MQSVNGVRKSALLISRNCSLNLEIFNIDELTKNMWPSVGNHFPLMLFMPE